MLTPEDFRRRVIRRFHRLGRLDNYDDLQVLELLLLFALPPESAQAAATELLEYYGSVASILEAPTVELQTFPHMTVEAMALIHLVPELGRYHMVQRACLARPLEYNTRLGHLPVAPFPRRAGRGGVSAVSRCQLSATGLPHAVSGQRQHGGCVGAVHRPGGPGLQCHLGGAGPQSHQRRTHAVGGG